MSEQYSRKDLSKDLFLLVKAGLLELSIREDGEWLYSVSEKTKALSEKEKLDMIMSINLDEDFEWEDDE